MHAEFLTQPFTARSLQEKINLDCVPYVLNMIYRIDKPNYTINEMRADVSSGAYSAGFLIQVLLQYLKTTIQFGFDFQELWSSFSYPF
jgi:hypothetical protein